MTLRRIFSNAYKTYGQVVDYAFSAKNLLYTNLLLSMGTSTIGDFIQQHYEYFNEEIYNYDLSRTAQMGFSGLIAGFICHHWYIILDQVITGKTIQMVVKKILLDQFICSPITILTFFATVAIFEDQPLDNFSEEVKHKFWTLYKAEWVVWPPAQVINFYFLPTRFRILYDNIISLGYDIYTSQVKHRKCSTVKTEKSN